MRKTLFALFFIFVSLTGCQKTPDGYDSDHRAVYLSNYSGKWMAVSYWAPWCSHCLKELLALNQIYLKHQDRLMVLGVSFDDLTDKQIQQFAKKQSLAFPLLSQFDMKKWGVETINNIPIIFLFSPDGQLKSTLLGNQAIHQLLYLIKEKE